jgi:uncharacterized protein (DUF433 family)
MQQENLSLKQILKKYPHLAEMHLEECLEQESVNEDSKDKKKDLLLG